MYTIHKSVQTDMPHTFEQVARLGYKGIEFYGPLNFDVSMVLHALTAAGLVLTGWHVEWSALQPETFDATVAYLLAVKCPIAVVPCLGGKWNIAHTQQQESMETWKRHIAWLNETRQRLSRFDIRMGYHNHEHEFVLQYDDKPLFDFLFDNLSQEIVMEFDSGNCIEGKDNPLRILKKYPKRPMLLHMKPYSSSRGFNVTLGEPDDQNDWEAILSARQCSFEWCLVESECTTLPEMDNVRLCMEGLRKYL